MVLELLRESRTNLLFLLVSKLSYILRGEKNPMECYMSTQFLSQITVPQENINIRANTIDFNSAVFPSSEIIFDVSGLGGSTGNSHSITFEGASGDASMHIFTVDAFDISGHVASTVVDLIWGGQPVVRPSAGAASTYVVAIDSNGTYHYGTFRHFSTNTDSVIRFQTTVSGDLDIDGFSCTFHGN